MERPSNKQLGWGIVAVAAILATLFFGVNYPVPPAPEETTGLGALEGEIALGEETRAGFRPIQVRALNVAQDLGVGGNVDIDGALTLGGDGLYPLGNPADGGVIEFGATGAISTTAITPVAISTVTAAGCNVNSPSAAAQLCYTVRSGNVITFTIYNSLPTPAAIVTPHASGASFWVAGNN